MCSLGVYCLVLALGRGHLTHTAYDKIRKQLCGPNGNWNRDLLNIYNLLNV